MPSTQNRLAKEKSPYLLQHANNPVDWYPWGEEALQKAKHENKPILLSIGYAACHWCHVMAHESFEDEETAAVMNQFFVNIKVDREERPDLDKIYQTAHYLLTGRSGGWPLTIFLTPDDLTPFFSGTYFPREHRYQLPAFQEIMHLLAKFYIEQRDVITQQNQKLIQALTEIHSHAPAAEQLTLVPVQHAEDFLTQQFDATYGGFGHAPKFPQAAKLEFLLKQHSTIVPTTLKQMAQGGINDQLSGGFYRYAVDRAWRIPHFEKMLYDNGQLLFLYTLAAKLYAEPLFADTTRKTSDWILAEMQAPLVGFFASIDADSEGKEGKFYLWDKQEIAKLLDEDEYKVIQLYYGLDQRPTVENHWHLAIVKTLDVVVKELAMTEENVSKLISSAKQKLLLTREKRIEPHRDEKILCSWNSLAIKGLLAASDILQEPRYLDAAKKALYFIRNKMWLHGRLFACYKDDHAYQPAYLDDYAFLLDALLEALQIEWNHEYFDWANELAYVLLDHFYDKKSGGFFFTADDQESLLYRPKTWTDEAIPSGNGIAVQALLTLGHLLGEASYLDAAEKTLHAAWSNLKNYPAEHATLLLALKEFLDPATFIVISGAKTEIKNWQEYCRHAKPLAKIFAIPSDEKEFPLTLTNYKTTQTNAFICQGTTCSAVIHDIEELRRTPLLTLNLS